MFVMRSRSNVHSCRCVHDGTCSDAFQAFTCACAAGFEGPICEINIDECASRPCIQRTAKCYDGTDSWACECKGGFRGERCEHVPPCASMPCKYGATCYDGGMDAQGVLSDGYICRCASARQHLYRGDSCQIHPPCNRDPCSRNDQRARCYDDEESHGLNNFTCVCASANPGGYTGTTCDRCIPGFESGPRECQFEFCLLFWTQIFLTRVQLRSDCALCSSSFLACA